MSADTILATNEAMRLVIFCVNRFMELYQPNIIDFGICTYSSV